MSSRGAGMTLIVDGTPRTYRDRKDRALEAARLLKRPIFRSAKDGLT